MAETREMEEVVPGTCPMEEDQDDDDGFLLHGPSEIKFSFLWDYDTKR